MDGEEGMDSSGVENSVNFVEASLKNYRLGWDGQGTSEAVNILIRTLKVWNMVYLYHHVYTSFAHIVTYIWYCGLQ